MSIATVEIRSFSGPDLVELGSANRPAIVRLNVGPKGDDGDPGPAGPNSVTSATTSDGTAVLSLRSATISDGGDKSIALNENGTIALINTSTRAEVALTPDGLNFVSDENGIAISVSGILTNGSYTSQNPITLDIAYFDSTGFYTASGSESSQMTPSSITTTGSIAASNLSGTNTGDQDLSGLVAKSAYTPAHSILAQQSGTGSPTAVTLGNNTILGRMSGGGSNIAGLSASDARTVMGLGTLATVNGGTGVATFLATPTSANLRAAITDETGTGSLVFANGNIGAATGDSLTLTKTASPNTREEIFRASVSDAPNDFIGIANGTVTGDRMAPVFFGMMNSVATNWSMGFSGYVSAANDASDSSNFGIVDFAALRSSSTTDPLNGTISNVSNRKLFTWRTGDTTYMTMTANGSLGVGTTAPSSRAILDLASTTRGFLPPRMTTAQRDAITSVPAGLMIYNTSTNKLNFFNGTAWEVIVSL